MAVVVVHIFTQGQQKYLRRSGHQMLRRGCVGSEVTTVAAKGDGQPDAAVGSKKSF